MGLLDYSYRISAAADYAASRAVPTNMANTAQALAAGSGASMTLVDLGSGVRAWRFAGGVVSGTAPSKTLALVGASLGLGIEMWNEFSQDLRWVESEDYGTLLVVRVLGPTPVQFNIDFLQVHQQYSFSFVYLPEDGAASRVQAIWVDGEVVDADMPESTALNLGINTMVNSAEDLDAWLAAREEG